MTEQSLADMAGYEIQRAINAIAQDAKEAAESTDLAHYLVTVRDAKRALSDVECQIERTLGERMGTKRVEIMGLGVLERHRDRSWRNWQHDDLLRMVLDSDRRIKDGDAGEVESDLDVLRHVYGLKGYNASRTALKDRGIDPEEYAEWEDRGWKVAIR